LRGRGFDAFPLVEPENKYRPHPEELATGSREARPDASVSKDGGNFRTRSHPSRRGQAAAPQDEVGDNFTGFAGTTLMTSSKSLSRTAPSTVTASTIVSSLLTVQTSGPGFVDLTSEVAKFVKDSGAREGAVTLFIRHTSASLTIQENADPSVLDDLMTALDRLAPEDGGWTHDTEGPDDMPAHIKTMLTASSLHIPVLNGELALGTWQAIYLIEHRARPHRREIVLQFIGASG
jgi:secondary thiamine-phosphate synthase enzyme